jgi:hypothetical protein
MPFSSLWPLGLSDGEVYDEALRPVGLRGTQFNFLRRTRIAQCFGKIRRELFKSTPASRLRDLYSAHFLAGRPGLGQ